MSGNCVTDCLNNFKVILKKKIAEKKKEREEKIYTLKEKKNVTVVTKNMFESVLTMNGEMKDKMREYEEFGKTEKSS